MEEGERERARRGSKEGERGYVLHREQGGKERVRTGVVRSEGEGT